MKKYLTLLICILLLLSGCTKPEKEKKYEAYFKGEYLCVRYNNSGYVKKVPVKNKEKYKMNFGDVNKDLQKEIILVSNDELLIYDFSEVPQELRLGYEQKFSVYPAGENDICVILDNGKSFTANTKSNKNLKVSKPYAYEFSDIDNGSDTEVLYKIDIKSGEDTVLNINCSEKYEHGRWYLHTVSYEVIN